MITQVIKRCNMKTTPLPRDILEMWATLRPCDGLKIFTDKSTGMGGTFATTLSLEQSFLLMLWKHLALQDTF